MIFLNEPDRGVADYVDKRRPKVGHYSREGHHWRFKNPLHWRILNRHNQLGSDELITSLPVMPNRQ
jgi:hypothetical protein